MHSTLKQSRTPQTSSTSIQGGIDQLERLLIFLASNLNATEPAGQPRDSSAITESPKILLSPARHSQPEVTTLDNDGQTELSDNFGRMSLEHAGTSYDGSAHWIAFLDGVGIFQPIHDSHAKKSD